MSLQGISAHGTVIRIKPAIADPTIANAWTAGQSVELLEVGDIKMPGLTRNEFDITSHNRGIDTYIFGVARRDAVTFPVFFNKAIFSHRMLRALAANNDVTTQMANEFTVTGPDGETLIFSGGVKGITQDNPVDGPQKAECTVRATGNYILDGIEYGTL